MSGSDKTRARRNAKERMNRLEGKATIKDLADLGSAVAVAEKEDDMSEVPVVVAEKSNATPAINILTGKIHEGFTVAADQLVQRGYIDQPQRIALSGLIGDMLGQFNQGIDPAVALTIVDAECADAIADKDAKALTVYKQADGTLRVVGWSSNNRRDRDNPPQILTDAAHKEFMAHLDAHPDQAPEFWHWHTPGTRYAKADVWDYVDGFTMYSGPVDPGKEAQAEKAASGADVGMSHGFVVLGYNPANEHITQYRTFEVSDLPKSRAANPYTAFSTIRKEAGMAFSPQKRAYLVEKMGEETVAKLERNSSEMKAAADAAGVEWKDLSADIQAPAAGPVAEKAAAAPEAAKPADTAKPGDAAATKLDPTISAEIRLIVAEELSKHGKGLEEVRTAVKTVAAHVATVEAKADQAATAAVSAQQAAAAHQKSLDEEIADILSPRKEKTGRGYRPTADAGTKVAPKAETTEKAAAPEMDEPRLPNAPANDWWLKEVLEPIGVTAI